jgi:hypothetical protein
MSKEVLSGKEMRFNGLLKIMYWVEEMSKGMEKMFEEYEWMEECCDEIIHGREMRWDLTDWREGSFKHTPEGLIEIGTYLLDLGYTIEEVCCDEDLDKYYKSIYSENFKFVEDVGFNLTEMGMGLQGMGSLWRIVDPDMEYDLVSEFFR